MVKYVKMSLEEKAAKKLASKIKKRERDVIRRQTQSAETEEYKLRERERARERRKHATEDQREKERERAKARRKNLTEEQKEHERERAKARRRNATEDDRERERERAKTRRRGLTQEEKAREAERAQERRKSKANNKTMNNMMNVVAVHASHNNINNNVDHMNNPTGMDNTISGNLSLSDYNNMHHTTHRLLHDHDHHDHHHHTIKTVEEFEAEADHMFDNIISLPMVPDTEIIITANDDLTHQQEPLPQQCNIDTMGGD